MLTASDNAADRRLADAIAAAGGSEVELGGRGLSIPLIAPDGQSHIAHVLPLGQGARQETGLLHAAIAAIFVRKASLDLAAPVDSVARRYGLTPTETQVLRAVVEYGGVTQIAANLGMSEATVKTHLQHLFGKTDSSRQVDLVKLTFSFADPLAS
jgi:DNA-binding CsgD family transcriptional regulator